MKIKTIAVLGAGRMGSIAAEQLPSEAGKIIVDPNLETASRIASKIGGKAYAEYSCLKDADIVLMVLPAPVIPEAAKLAAQHVRPGTILVNMATKGVVPEDLKALFPDVLFVDAKIIGHAISMRDGAPCFVVVNAEGEVFERVKYALPGYAAVVQGDSTLVPQINSIASSEGIRAAVRVKKQVKGFNIPEEWIRPLVYTVCAGTMRAYIDNNLGEFAQKLAEQFEKED